MTDSVYVYGSVPSQKKEVAPRSSPFLRQVEAAQQVVLRFRARNSVIFVGVLFITLLVVLALFGSDNITWSQSAADSTSIFSSGDVDFTSSLMKSSLSSDVADSTSLDNISSDSVLTSSLMKKSKSSDVIVEPNIAQVENQVNQIQDLITLMDNLQNGKTESIPLGMFDTAPSYAATNSVALVTATDEPYMGTKELEKYVEKLGKSSGSNDALDGIIQVFKLALTAYNYVVSDDKKISYSTYERDYGAPGVDLSYCMKKMDGFPPPYELFKTEKIIRIFNHVVPFAIVLALRKKKAKKVIPENKFKQLVGGQLSPVPKNKHVIEHWEDDREFARQFLAGTNPVMINVVKDLSQLSESIVNYFGEGKLEKMKEQDRLFFVDYVDLAELSSPPPNGRKREFYAPIVLFYLNSQKTELHVKGIQLERTNDAKVYTSDDGDAWLYAKTHVASADTNIHEWVSHLGNTHLTMEPFIIAIHNTLRLKNHPLYTFFKPLVKDTLFLNWAARQTLARSSTTEKDPKGAVGNQLSSIGIAQYLQIIKKKWVEYDFFKSSGLPGELESRGFDKDFKMPSYLFREDGMKLWNAYGDFAKDYVDEIYSSDADVANDDIVQEWAEETTSFEKAAVPGFPESIHDKATLVSIMQTLMWVASGLHAAVNYSQYDYLSFVPNKPMFTYEKIDPPATAQRKEIFDKVMPDVDTAVTVMNLIWGLTLPSKTCIDNLDDDFSGAGKNAYDKFKLKLNEIGKANEQRNKEKREQGEAVYPYLNPSVVSASIDI